MIELKHLTNQEKDMQPHRQSIRKKGGNTGKWVRECKCGQRREHAAGWFDGDRGAFRRAWLAAERHLRVETAKSYDFV